jgi:DNA-binding GntR family transcriptional regulator
VIEASLLAQAGRRPGASGLAALRAHLAAEAAAEAAGDRRRGIRLSGAFHLHIARLAGNRVLLDFLTALVSRSSLILALYEAPGAAACGRDDHAAILEALAAGDAARAGQEMTRHLDACEARLGIDGAEAPVDFARLFTPLRLRTKGEVLPG